MSDDNGRFDALAALLGFLDLRRQSRIEKGFEKEKKRESDRLRKLREQNDEKNVSEAQALPEPAAKTEGEKSTDLRAAMARVCSKLPKSVLAGLSLAANILRAIFVEAPWAGLCSLAQGAVGAWRGARRNGRFVATTTVIGLLAAWFTLGMWMSSPGVIVWIQANSRGAAFLAQESAYPEVSEAQEPLAAKEPNLGSSGSASGADQIRGGLPAPAASSDMASPEAIAARGVRLPVLDHQLGFDTRRIEASDWALAERSDVADIAGVAALSRCIAADACRVAKIPTLWSGMAWGLGFSNAAVDALPLASRKPWLRPPSIWGGPWQLVAALCLSAGLILSLIATSVWWIVAGGSEPGSREWMAALLAHAQNTLVALCALAVVFALFLGLPFVGSLSGQSLAPAGAMAAQALVGQGQSGPLGAGRSQRQKSGGGPRIDVRAVNWSWGSLPAWTKEDQYRKLYRDCEAAGYCGDRDAVENRAKKTGFDAAQAIAFARSDTETLGWGAWIFIAAALTLAPALGRVLDIGSESRWERRLEEWSTHGAQRAERQRILRAMRGVKKAPVSPVPQPSAFLTPDFLEDAAPKPKSGPRRL